MSFIREWVPSWNSSVVEELIEWTALRGEQGMLVHAVVLLQSDVMQSSWSVEVDKLMWRVSSKMTWSCFILSPIVVAVVA